jgi:hypothetical protein
MSPLIRLPVSTPPVITSPVIAGVSTLSVSFDGRREHHARKMLVTSNVPSKNCVFLIEKYSEK